MRGDGSIRKQNGLEHLGNIRTEQVAENYGVYITLGKLRGTILGREQNVDPFVDGFFGDKIMYETLACLRDPMNTVLRLKVVI